MLSIIVAKTRNNVIGLDGEMPWHQRNDLQRFKAMTYGRTVIMGRKTFESIGEKLPNRKNIIITRNKNEWISGYDIDPNDPDIQYSFSPVSLFQSYSDIYKAENPESLYPKQDAFLIGGGILMLYGLQYADVMHITELDCEIEGDTFFQVDNWDEWKLVAKESYKKDDVNTYDYSFLTYARKNKN